MLQGYADEDRQIGTENITKTLQKKPAKLQHFFRKVAIPNKTNNPKCTVVIGNDTLSISARILMKQQTYKQPRLTLTLP